MSFHPAWTSHSNSSSRLPDSGLIHFRLLAFHSLANETSASAFSYFQQPTPLLKFTVVDWTALYTERFSVTETCADYLVQPTFCWALDDNLSIISYQVAQDGKPIPLCVWNSSLRDYHTQRLLLRGTKPAILILLSSPISDLRRYIQE